MDLGRGTGERHSERDSEDVLPAPAQEGGRGSGGVLHSQLKRVGARLSFRAALDRPDLPQSLTQSSGEEGHGVDASRASKLVVSET